MHCKLFFFNFVLYSPLNIEVDWMKQFISVNQINDTLTGVEDVNRLSPYKSLLDIYEERTK